VPLARYFVVVGSVLAALVLIANWSLPEPPPSFPDWPEITERAVIRITSERKWPEKVVLDADQPTFSLPSVEVAPAQQPVEPPFDEMTDQAGIDAQAEPNPDARSIDAHRSSTRAMRKTRKRPSTHVARARIRGKRITLGTGEECCRSEWADTPAMSKAASRKRVARRDSWTGWHFPEVN
jgi:hypothetical protein